MLSKLKTFLTPTANVFIPKPGDDKRSSLWPRTRGLYLADHPLCAACGGKENVQVHHVKPFHAFPQLELDSTNLISLCEAPAKNCHYCFGHGYNWTGWNPTVRIDAARFLETVVASRKLAETIQ